MTTLIFVRHGESQANIQTIFAGHLDIDLSEKGKKQAELSAKYIKQHYIVDKIYASDLKRAMSTAEPISRLFGIEITPQKNLREIFAGKWEGLTFENLQSTYAQEYGVWLKDIGNATPMGGESVKDLSNRIWIAVDEIANACQNQTVVIVTHATPIRTIMGRLQGMEVQNLKSVPWCGNASLTVVSVHNGNWKLEDTNITQHLEGCESFLPANV